MERRPKTASTQYQDLQRGMDAFLDEQEHSEEAYQKVERAIDKFDFMVELAVSRALAEIYGEHPYEPTDQEAVIIEFPIDRIKKRH